MWLILMVIVYVYRKHVLLPSLLLFYRLSSVIPSFLNFSFCCSPVHGNLETSRDLIEIIQSLRTKLDDGLTPFLFWSIQLFRACDLLGPTRAPLPMKNYNFKFSHSRYASSTMEINVSKIGSIVFIIRATNIDFTTSHCLIFATSAGFFIVLSMEPRFCLAMHSAHALPIILVLPP